MAAPLSPAAISTERQMITLPIAEGLSCFRGLSPQRSRFELEYALERGSTANSFLFAAGPDASGVSQAAVLVHPPGAAYASVFLPVLHQALPDPAAKLMVVVGHVNPNRVALLRDLACAYSGLELVASNAGAKLLRELWSLRRPPAPGDDTPQPLSLIHI